MTVKELVSCCYDTVVIYTNTDDEMLEFKDLYKGNRDNIPSNLLNLSVCCYGAKRKGVIDIAVRI